MVKANGTKAVLATNGTKAVLATNGTKAVLTTNGTKAVLTWPSPSSGGKLVICANCRGREHGRRGAGVMRKHVSMLTLDYVCIRSMQYHVMCELYISLFGVVRTINQLTQQCFVWQMLLLPLSTILSQRG